MYHNKHFQIEPLFPLIATNHGQVQKSTRAGYILADRNKFHEISHYINNLDTATLRDIVEHIKSGPVKP